MSKKISKLPSFEIPISDEMRRALIPIKLSLSTIKALKIADGGIQAMKQCLDDSERAKRLLLTSDELLKLTMPSALAIVESELAKNGQLTPRQLVFLILESKGIDTLQHAKELGSKGGLAKTGHKSDIYYALREVTQIKNSDSYAAIANYLNSLSDTQLENIVVIKSQLPTKLGLEGCLEYQNSKGKVKTIKSDGIATHLRNIKISNK